MYWSWDHNNPDIKERVYSESAEYGIHCRVQDLQEIVNGLNKYMKKTKVRSAGLNMQLGVLNRGGPGISDSCWKEWLLEMGASKKNALTAEQGLLESIGFPLEVLHVYDRDEMSWGCPLWGTWENTDGKWKKYSPTKTEN